MSTDDEQTGHTPTPRACALVLALVFIGCSPTAEQLANLAIQDRHAELAYERTMENPKATGWQRFVARWNRPAIPPPSQCLAEGTESNYDCQRGAMENVAHANAVAAGVGAGVGAAIVNSR